MLCNQSSCLIRTKPWVYSQEHNKFIVQPEFIVAETSELEFQHEHGLKWCINILFSNIELAGSRDT